jgi:hypothetical protein
VERDYQLKDESIGRGGFTVCKKRKKNKCIYDKKNTNMVTNLKAMSFGSLLSSLVTAPVHFFALLGVGVVGVRLAVVECLSPHLCHKISRHQRDS